MTEWGSAIALNVLAQPGRGARKNYGSGIRFGWEKSVA